MIRINLEWRQLFFQKPPVQKLRKSLQYYWWRWLRGTWQAPTQPTEPIWQISNYAIEQHLGICNTYHLQKKPLSLHTCAGFPCRLTLPRSPQELRGELTIHQGNPLGLAALFHASPKEMWPIKAALCFMRFLWWELLFILECLLAHFPIFRSLNAFSSLALTPLHDYLQSLAGL